MLPAQAQKQLLEALSDYDAIEAQSVARILMRDVFQTDHRQTKPLGIEQCEELNRICERLKSGEPMQYITGWADFFGLRFRVNHSVLIPRMETETLISACLEKLRKRKISRPEILDIGTGSGCIAVTLAKKIPDATVIGIDISPEALLVAEANAELNHTKVGFILHDVLRAGHLPVQGFDLLVSNPPYISLDEKSLMPKRVLEFEPHQALFAPEDDPLCFYKRIAAHAAHHLYAGGILAFECNEFRTSEVATLLRSTGWQEVEVLKDLSGADRVVLATQPDGQV